jgi:hypothetical protein
MYDAMRLSPTRGPAGTRADAISYHAAAPSYPLFVPLPSSAMTSSTPKLLPLTSGPRLIVYHQTIHDPQGNYHSLLPLLTNNTGITHVIVAAIHLNEGPGNITLNDHRPDDKRFDQLWGEVAWLQGSGVNVLGMLGGAAKGSFERLSGDDDSVLPPPPSSTTHTYIELVRSPLHPSPHPHHRTQPKRSRPRH